VRSNIEKALEYKSGQTFVYKDRIRHMTRIVTTTLLSKRNIITFLYILVVILSSYFVFPQDQIKIFVSFIIIVPVCLTLKSEVSPVLYSIALLILSGFELAGANYLVANRLSLYSYWLLVAGLIIYFIEFLNSRYAVKYTNSKLQQ
jgi:hypothetical protein